MLAKKPSSFVHLFVVAGAVLVFLSLVVTLNPHPTHFWFQYWWMFPIALLIATIVNTIGISGAALFVPFFILIFPLLATPLTSLESVQLGLITESFGLSSSALAFLAFGLVDSTVGFYAIVGAVPFVIGGAVISSLVPQTILYLMIAALLIISIFLLHIEEVLKKRLAAERGSVVDLSTPEGKRITKESLDGRLYHYCRTRIGYLKRFFGYGVGGFFQGAAGFGVGELGIISMVLTGVPTRIAIGTSHIVVAVSAIVASIVHITLSSSAAHAPVLWNILVMTVPAVVIGGQLAPFIAAQLPSTVLNKFITVVFVGIAISLVLLAVGA